MIEALVAITVLVIGVVGPLSLLANSIYNANYARDQITAFFLAQEAQEMLINYRDNQRLDIFEESGGGDPSTDLQDRYFWLRGLEDCFGKECFMETRHPYWSRSGDVDNIKYCGEDNGRFPPAADLSSLCPYLTEDAAGFYGYNSGLGAKLTRFVREIKIDLVGGERVESAQVKVVIRWRDQARERSFELNSMLYR